MQHSTCHKVLPWLFILPAAFSCGMATLTYNSIYLGASEQLSGRFAKATFIAGWSLGSALQQLGSLFAALLLPRVEKTFGTKDGMFLADLTFIISLYLISWTGFASSMLFLFLGKILLGFSRITLANLIIMLTRDIAPIAHRALYNNIVFGTRFLGMSCVTILSFRGVLGTPTTWVWILIIPALLIFPAILVAFCMPPVPRLLLHGANQAEDLRRSIRFYPSAERQTDFTDSRKHGVMALLRDKSQRRKVVIVILFSCCLIFGGLPVLEEYSTPILTLIGQGSIASWATLAATGLTFPIALGTGAACDFLGRRTVLRSALVLVFLFLLCFWVLRITSSTLISVPCAGNGHHVVNNTCENPLNRPMTGLLVAWFATEIGILYPLKLIVIELFSPEFQAAALSTCVITQSTLGIIVTMSLLPLETYKPGLGFGLLLGCYALAAIPLWSLCQETKPSASHAGSKFAASLADSRHEYTSSAVPFTDGHSLSERTGLLHGSTTTQFVNGGIITI